MSARMVITTKLEEQKVLDKLIQFKNDDDAFIVRLCNINVRHD